MRQIRLTKAAIEKTAPRRNGGRLDYTVRDHPGLILRVSRGWGRVNRSWLFRQPARDGTKGGRTFGVYPGSRNPRGLPELDAGAAKAAWLQKRAEALRERSLDDEIEAARKKLEQLLEQKGRDVSLEDLWTSHQETQAKAGNSSPLTRKQEAGRMQKHVPPAWWREPAGSRTRLEIVRLVDQIAKTFPHAAARVLANFAAAYRHGLDRGLVFGRSPAEGIRSIARKSKRKRYLSPEAVKAVWGELHRLSPTAGCASRILLLTGQRREAVIPSEWSEFDLVEGWWTIPAARLKGRDEDDEDHEVRLGPLCLEILRRRFEGRRRKHARHVFESPQARCHGKHANMNTFSNRVSRLSETLAREGIVEQTFRAHDFRRTISTLLVQECDVDPVVVQWILHHEIKMDGPLGHYVIPRLRRQAAEAWLQWDRYLREELGLRAS